MFQRKFYKINDVFDVQSTAVVRRSSIYDEQFSFVESANAYRGVSLLLLLLRLFDKIIESPSVVVGRKHGSVSRNESNDELTFH